MNNHEVTKRFFFIYDRDYLRSQLDEDIRSLLPTSQQKIFDDWVNGVITSPVIVIGNLHRPDLTNELKWEMLTHCCSDAEAVAMIVATHCVDAKRESMDTRKNRYSLDVCDRNLRRDFRKALSKLPNVSELRL